MENVYEIVTYVIGIAFLFGIVGRFLPNEKLYNWGFALGKTVGGFGFLKMGDGWEKVESFLINSFGQFFNGVKDGLNNDDPKE